MKRRYPKLFYFYCVLLVLWSALLVFSLLISFGLVSWHSKITALQYILAVCGIVSSAAQIRFWRKKSREQ